MATIHTGTTMAPTKLELLAGWLPQQPWYRATGEPPTLTRAGGFRLDDPAGEVGIEFLLVGDGAETTYLVPMTYRAAPLDGADDALIGTSEHGVLGTRWIYDAAYDPVAVTQLLDFLCGGCEAQSQSRSDTPDPSVGRSWTSGGRPTAVEPARGLGRTPAGPPSRSSWTGRRAPWSSSGSRPRRSAGRRRAGFRRGRLDPAGRQPGPGHGRRRPVGAAPDGDHPGYTGERWTEYRPNRTPSSSSSWRSSRRDRVAGQPVEQPGSAADQGGRDRQVELVDDAGGQRRAEQGRAALAEHVLVPELGQPVQRQSAGRRRRRRRPAPSTPAAASAARRPASADAQVTRIVGETAPATRPLAGSSDARRETTAIGHGRRPADRRADPADGGVGLDGAVALGGRGPVRRPARRRPAPAAPGRRAGRPGSPDRRCGRRPSSRRPARR